MTPADEATFIRARLWDSPLLMARERLSRLQRRSLAWLGQVVDTDNIHQTTAVEPCWPRTCG